jgi:hypothetical protein
MLIQCSLMEPAPATTLSSCLIPTPAGTTPNVRAAYLVDPIDGFALTKSMLGYPSAVKLLRDRSMKLGITGEQRMLLAVWLCKQTDPATATHGARSVGTHQDPAAATCGASSVAIYTYRTCYSDRCCSALYGCHSAVCVHRQHLAY